MNIQNSQKWLGTETYRASKEALGAIVAKFKNPTYAQIEDVLECMRDLAKDYCVFKADNTERKG